MDTWAGSAVDSILLLDDTDSQINLPFFSGSFLLERPYRGTTKDSKSAGNNLSTHSILWNSPGDINSYVVELVAIRKMVLR